MKVPKFPVKWEQVATDSGKLFRARVYSGWLVRLEYGDDTWQLTYVPDPGQNWQPAIIED